jgi:hypothetical protein
MLEKTTVLWGEPDKMTTNLAERKSNLLNQIKKLNREIDGLKWLEYERLDLYHYAAGMRYPEADTLRENLIN